MYEINFIAILIAAVGAIVFGAIWYSPMLFGKMWAQLEGFDTAGNSRQTKSHMKMSYTVMFFMNLLKASVLYLLIFLTGASSFGQMMLLAFLTWAGFILSGIVVDGVWKKKSAALITLDTIFTLGMNIVTVLILMLFV